MQASFFWHDYETFGVDPRRDRPAQFAGIRTDRDLNEIGTALSLYCQPMGDYLPDPESVLLTGITPAFCQMHGLVEYQFAQHIEQALAQPGTIGVGYNTIRFDDEVTRFLFWRNLIEPYGREWQNQCGRWDILDLVRTCYALRPEGITWPKNEEGQISFKLVHLTQANGLAHEQAHDALSDVRATIALARFIKQQKPRLWDFCLALHKKEAVLAQIGTRQAFWHISGMYRVERGCLALVFPLAFHPRNKNELIVWDLSHDPRVLESLDVSQIRERLFTKTQDLPSGIERLAIKTIHINRSPIVIGQLKTVTPDIAQRWGIDVPQALAYADWLNPQVSLWQDRWAQVYASASTEQPEAVDVDAALYEGFVSFSDRQQLDRLRQRPVEQWADKVSSGVFEDARLVSLLFRYRARHFPQTLDSAERQRWAEHLERCERGEVHGLGYEALTRKIEVLSRSATPAQQAYLNELQAWAVSHQSRSREGL
jgi:exodeoxyribonuclease-1